MKRSIAVLPALALLAGCMVADIPYPADWQPLPVASSAECRGFGGRYADRGEAPDGSERSFTRELFGKDAPWQKAASFALEMPQADTLDVTVSSDDGVILTKRFSATAKTLKCDGGRLVLRNRRWVVSDVMSGRETVQMELHFLAGYVVTHEYEVAEGVVFAVVPLAGESARWYRYRRLKS